VKQLAVITGASRGIGRAAAERFISAGWEVWNLSRSPCTVAGVIHHSCNLADLKALRNIVGRWDVKPYGRVCIVHNAAKLLRDSAATLEEGEFLDVLTLNVVAAQLINRLLIPQMKQGSSIIFIGSTHSESAIAGRLSYIASKHALAGLMRGTSNDIAEQGLHSCLIAPGFTDTQMLREAIGGSAEDIRRAQEASLLGRLVAPEEIAELIFFCSTNASINGAVLHANLGQKTA
jgi:NAD(P)-dependent dehydrogenase (short-subunit alcohol dehydrogenase family)